MTKKLAQKLSSANLAKALMLNHYRWRFARLLLADKANFKHLLAFGF
jgi:hypothetical protein